MIVKKVKEVKPHGIVVCLAPHRLDDGIVNALLVLKYCLGGVLSDSRVVYLFNMMPNDYKLRRSSKNLEQVLQDYLDKMQARLELSIMRVNAVPNQSDSVDGITELFERIAHMPDEPMDTSVLQTWTEVVNVASKIKSGQEAEAAVISGMIQRSWTQMSTTHKNMQGATEQDIERLRNEMRELEDTISVKEKDHAKAMEFVLAARDRIAELARLVPPSPYSKL